MRILGSAIVRGLAFGHELSEEVVGIGTLSRAGGRLGLGWACYWGPLVAGIAALVWVARAL